MKYLEIRSNGKVYFLKDEDKYAEIDQINKEDIFRLLGIATDPEKNFEMDPITDDNIKNEAHRIIYTSLYTKFEEILENRTRFVEESKSLYKDALQKYE